MAAVLLLGWGSLQIVAQDLDVPAVIVDEATGLDGELEQLYREAEAVFRSSQQPRSVPLFTDVLRRIEQLAAARELEPWERRLLMSSLFHRAEARFNLGENADAETDLRSLLEVDPAFEVDAASVSPKLARLLESLRSDMVGYVELRLEPADAEVRFDGQALTRVPGLPVAVLAGPHDLEVERAGFTPVSRQILVEPGTSLTLDLDMERVSAVVQVMTRPPGATVSIDGRPVGTTGGTAPPDLLLRGDAARFPPEEFSAVLSIQDLQVGDHTLEIRKDGYRVQRGRVVVEELIDLSLAPVILEKAVGTLVLSGMWKGAELAIDGKKHVVGGPEGGLLRVELSPGEHTVVVSRGTVGRFQKSFAIEDLGTLELTVRLRPSLTLLGVLGGDTVAGEALVRGLTDSFEGLEEWAVTDCIDAGPELLAELGIGTQMLRREADAAPGEGALPDWQPVQSLADGRCPGSVYLLAVLSDDLYAAHADLWMWSAAPGPHRPERRRVALEGSGDVEEVVSAFSVPLKVTVPWLGAQLVESEAVDAPVVTSVTAVGPAAEAGLMVGDRISMIDGSKVSTTSEALTRLEGLEPGSIVNLEVQAKGGVRTLSLEVGSSAAVISLEDPGLLSSVVSARMASALTQTELPAPEWVLRLNQAAILLRGGVWREAVTVLRTIRAPVGPGLGQAAVDYWLGVALLAVDPTTYGESARGALVRAMEVPEARLYHNDGPLVAPRARARLDELGGSNQ